MTLQHLDPASIARYAQGLISVLKIVQLTDAHSAADSTGGSLASRLQKAQFDLERARAHPDAASSAIPAFLSAIELAERLLYAGHPEVAQVMASVGASANSADSNHPAEPTGELELQQTALLLKELERHRQRLKILSD